MVDRTTNGIFRVYVRVITEQRRAGRKQTMDTRLKWVRVLGIVCAANCALVMLSACAIELLNQGEVGLRYGSEITFFHRASKTSDELATSSVEAPALIDWIVGPSGDEANDRPESAGS
jgi:hypothetical protein